MAAITIATAKMGRASHYVVNDLNKPLVDVLQSVIETPKTLIADYTEGWNEQFSYEGGSVEHFYKIRDEFNGGNQSAANMLYLLARCVKGSVRYDGEDLPDGLDLQKVLLNAGLSSQSLLLGKKEVTYEALYISRGLQQFKPRPAVELQYSFLETMTL